MSEATNLAARTVGLFTVKCVSCVLEDLVLRWRAPPKGSLEKSVTGLSTEIYIRRRRGVYLLLVRGRGVNCETERAMKGIFTAC